MRLVTFEDPIWSTIQGEGTLVGTPSVFVRMYGCDLSCEWCDSKGSWKPGSTSQEWTVDMIVNRVRAANFRHAVITGGNPLLQPGELADLCAALQTPWTETWRQKQRGDRPGMHVTIETQASIFEEGIINHIDLASLSPKLHDWRQDVLLEWISEVLKRPNKQAQIKVVSLDEASTVTALERMTDVYAWALKRWPAEQDRLHFILQPEFSTGRKGVEVVRSTLERCLTGSPPGSQYPLFRVIPQIHKSALFVR